MSTHAMQIVIYILFIYVRTFNKYLEEITIYMNFMVEALQALMLGTDEALSLINTITVDVA